MELGYKNVDPSSQAQRRGWRRFLAFFVVLLIGVGIGWWLAPKCTKCSQPSAASGGADGTAPSVRPGSANGPASTTSGGGAAGTTGGAGGGGNDVGTAGSAPPASGPGITVVSANGNAKPDGTKEGAAAAPVGGDAQGMVDALAGGRRSPGDGSDQPPGQAPTPDKMRTASDFTYDQTGLPRYPDSVTGVFSAASVADSGTPDGKHSSCTIVTSNDFGAVVGWYRAHLPAGWNDRTVHDVARLAGQVAPDTLMKMLAQTASGTQQASAGTPAPAAHDPGPSVAIFSPPDGTPGEVGIMITQQPGNPVRITLSKAGGGS
jgi:hypothetical protein